jgi:hypothetical protein
MAWGNTIISPRILDLIEFQLSVLMPGFSEPGLQITSAAATTVIVGSVGMHVNEILFTHNRSDDKPQVFCNRISKAFSHQLARILNSKLNL